MRLLHYRKGLLSHPLPLSTLTLQKLWRNKTLRHIWRLACLQTATTDPPLSRKLSLYGGGDRKSNCPMPACLTRSSELRLRGAISRVSCPLSKFCAFRSIREWPRVPATLCMGSKVTWDGIPWRLLPVLGCWYWYFFESRRRLLL